MKKKFSTLKTIIIGYGLLSYSYREKDSNIISICLTYLFKWRWLIYWIIVLCVKTVFLKESGVVKMLCVEIVWASKCR